MSDRNYYEWNTKWQKELPEEEKQLKELLTIVQRELAHAPAGSLQIKQQGGRTWYLQRYRAPGARDLYLNEKNRAMVSLLAQKKYDEKLLRAVQQELAQLEKGKRLSFTDLGAVYDSFPETWKQFIVPHVLPDELFIEQWLAHYRDGASGDPFKSKSEQLHDRIYTALKAPSVYEPELYLPDFGPVRPDFVVLNVHTRQTFFHEHFGMMGDPEYCARALAKLNAYHRNGFFEGKNLLITMESERVPFNAEDGEAYFREFLL